MRTFQRKQILDIFQTFGDALNHLKQQQYAHMDPNLSLLEEMQSNAYIIAEYIASEKGTSSKLHAALIEFCQLIKRAAVHGKLMKNATDMLEAQLNNIEKIAANELVADKWEVAFFPYKADMWDSMESIYLSAKQDPKCDAYCIPIPWYDKNPDGTLHSMHYDGGNFPSNIEITDWKQYDVSTRRPDAIFIHFPFDGRNHVTTVHPQYYSSILKAHTDLLVYVDYGLPYWTHQNASSEVTAENAYVHPAYIHCDLYPNYSREAAEFAKLSLLLYANSKKTHTQSIVDKKVIALGSAKFDKVLHTKKDDCKLPDEWRACIGNKKVLLYYTSISGILYGSEYFLEKVRSVIDTLRNRDDIVLWWRPHPLSLSTFQSMRPQLADAYAALVDDYQRSFCGIYDDTSDFHRAIAYSDGCMADESSFPLLYLAAGKPFCITSIEKKLPSPIIQSGNTFSAPLQQRLANMRKAKGANAYGYNCCIWWDNFLEEDVINNIHYDEFLPRFLHFIVYNDAYPDADEYRQLQNQMLRDFVVNSDGTAGQNIYHHCKQMILGV